MRAVAIFIVNKYVALHTHYVIMLKTFSRVVLHSTTKSIIKNKKIHKAL